MEITSARGRAFAALKPAFLDVLGDLWDAQSNPDGIVNLGLAEKVGQKCADFFLSSSLTFSDPHACGDDGICQQQCKRQLYPRLVYQGPILMVPGPI